MQEPGLAAFTRSANSAPGAAGIAAVVSDCASLGGRGSAAWREQANGARASTRPPATNVKRTVMWDSPCFCKERPSNSWAARPSSNVTLRPRAAGAAGRHAAASALGVAMLAVLVTLVILALGFRAAVRTRVAGVISDEPAELAARKARYARIAPAAGWRDGA